MAVKKACWQVFSSSENSEKIPTDNSDPRHVCSAVYCFGRQVCARCMSAVSLPSPARRMPTVSRPSSTSAFSRSRCRCQPAPPHVCREPAQGYVYHLPTPPDVSRHVCCQTAPQHVSVSRSRRTSGVSKPHCTSGVSWPRCTSGVSRPRSASAVGRPRSTSFVSRPHRMLAVSRPFRPRA